MSGGAFDYIQFRFDEVIDLIEELIERNNTELEDHERWMSDSFYEKYPEEKLFSSYKPETIEEFRKAIKSIKLTKHYIHRIDWLVSGDDGEDNFLKYMEEKCIEELY